LAIRFVGRNDAAKAFSDSLCTLLRHLALWCGPGNSACGAGKSARLTPFARSDGESTIRDYLQSRQSFRDALDQNRADLLDPAFVGTAKDKLRGTIQRQAALGIHTRYRLHDVQIVFCSPEGLSIELTDEGEYDMELLDYRKVKTIQHVSARYVIVLTPAEVQWRVRVFQSEPK